MKQGKDGDNENDAGSLGPLPGGHHGLTPEQVASSQRERLLAATAHVVALRGYRATTMTEIVKFASVANRAFYANFSTVEESFLATLKAVSDHLESLLRTAVAAQSEWPLQVVAAVREALAFFTAEPDSAVLCLLAPSTSTTTIASRWSENVRRAAPFLEQGRAERPENGSLPPSTEEALLGGAISVAAYSLEQDDRPLTDLLLDLAEFLLTPYLGGEEAKKLAAGAAETPDE